MSILISFALMGCGGFILFCFAHSMVFMGGIFFALFCGLLYLLDETLEEEKQARIQRLVKSASPMASLQPLGHPYPASMPLGHLSSDYIPNTDSFSTIDWSTGDRLPLPEFQENPYFGKQDESLEFVREVFKSWNESTSTDDYSSSEKETI